MTIVPVVVAAPVATTYLLVSPAMVMMSPATMPVVFTVPVSKVSVVSPIACDALLINAPVIAPLVVV